MSTTDDVPLTHRVVHRTAYDYSSTVTDAYSVTTLLPRTTPLQTVLESRIDATPAADEFDERDDVFGNHVVQLGLHQAHDRFEVTGTSVVTVRQGLAPTTSAAWETVVESNSRARGAELLEIGSYLAITPSVESGPGLAALFVDDFAPGRPLVDVARAVSRRIHDTFAFDPAATDVSTPLDEVVANGRGVCQDFAHLAIAVLRGRGLAARYVSGYIETDPPPGEPKSVGADASHAWCSLHVPGYGWLDIDPTNDQVPTSRHVTVAWGRDYRDVAPVRGVVIGPSAAQTLEVSVDVQRVT